ncbi:MAG: carbohydrate kinase family protein [Armatimonadota bacterium]|nr:carbohydrate kinase family protein [Armatimonadota bacterium]MDR7587685.1 carbohydrate kinase family protein [Armatimonadota bacterium]MDR7611486.1 carbohydrate kinase family protein [Armatimonadota bacterium]
MTHAAGIRLDAIACGAAAVDLVIRVPRLPAYDEKVVGALVGRLPGGTMANFACALARLGGRAAWMGTVGADPDGALLMQDFRRFGVDTRHVQVVRHQQTNFTVILLGRSAERAIVVVPSLRERLPPKRPLRQYLSTARFVYLSPHDLALAHRVATEAAAAGCRLALEVEPTAALTPARGSVLLPRTHLAVFNRGGLASFWGMNGVPRAGHAVRAARRVLELGPQVVAVTLGRHGAILADSTRVVVHPGFRVRAVDTTGAGDCFSAALVLGLCRGWPLEQIAAYANAAAALSTTGLGPRGHLPRHREVVRFLRSHGCSWGEYR